MNNKKILIRQKLEQKNLLLGKLNESFRIYCEERTKVKDTLLIDYKYALQIDGILDTIRARTKEIEMLKKLHG
jgi:hypothetical protein